MRQVAPLRFAFRSGLQSDSQVIECKSVAERAGFEPASAGQTRWIISPRPYQLGVPLRRIFPREIDCEGLVATSCSDLARALFTGYSNKG